MSLHCPPCPTCGAIVAQVCTGHKLNEVHDDALEEAARMIEGGNFLHMASVEARIARAAAKAIRAIKYVKDGRGG
jgi:hypothetical protein